MGLSRQQAKRVRALQEYALLLNVVVALALAASSRSTLAVILAAGMICQALAHMLLKPAVRRRRPRPTARRK
jgi:hypothetical protein